MQPEPGVCGSDFSADQYSILSVSAYNNSPSAMSIDKGSMSQISIGLCYNQHWRPFEWLNFIQSVDHSTLDIVQNSSRIT
jgi:hypothetical protein